ncbi:hypothetical protein [Alkalihalobacillus trypoxylicola]|uniref:DUF5067 domain-containing protein n=1 Tax=Alkalihalobacillus trypoxylicola TaxID=519424 RepID=A0A162EIX2_9BACI|nr:hypothetical protein [Alkalihalobacillus trypoxylicola]KYG33017.1 hypothetical protein AZF04_17815 [Alkalihalobacillus trypoxylicola]
MKKYLLGSALLAVSITLGACGDSDDSSNSSEETTNQTEEAAETSSDNSEVDIYTAEAGDTVVDEYVGEYHFTDVINVNENFTSGPIEGVFESVKVGTFTPEDEGDTLNIVTVVATTENTSDDQATFSLFGAILTTDTGQQIDAEMGLNDGESTHIGKVNHEQYVTYNLGNETIEDINELNFHIRSTSVDNTSVGEDFTITVETN